MIEWRNSRAGIGRSQERSELGKPRPLTLRRLVDVCDLLKGIPTERRGDAWQYAQRTLDEAAQPRRIRQSGLGRLNSAFVHRRGAVADISGRFTVPPTEAAIG